MRWLGCLALFAWMVAAWADGTLPAPDEGALGVTGVWRAQATEVNAGGGWLAQGNRWVLTIPDGSTGTYAIKRDELLPDGAWTLDLWLTQESDLAFLPYTITLGQPNSAGGYLNCEVDPQQDRAEIGITRAAYEGGGYQNNGGGKIAWVRLVNVPNPPHCNAYLNGEPLELKTTAATFPRGPLALSIATKYKTNETMRFTLAGCAVQLEARFLPDQAPGIAWHGWTGLTAARQPADVLARVQQVEAAADNTAKGRAYALAAQVLLGRAAGTSIPPDLWARVTTQLTAALDHDPEQAIFLLPVVAASANEAQRTPAADWSNHFFTDFHNRPRNDQGLLSREALLDPIRATHEAVIFTRKYDIPDSLMAELEARHAPSALALECMRYDSNDLSCQGWHFAEWQRVSPIYYQLLLEQFRNRQGRRLFNSNEPDRSSSYAAYALAPIDLAAALNLCNGITRPDVKADTLDAIFTMQQGAAPPAATEQIEANLIDAVAQFKPTQRIDTPGAEMNRLARWYQRTGMSAKALRTVKQMMAHIGQTKSSAFHDSWYVYLLLRDLKNPDAPAWLQKSEVAAMEFDKDQQDYPGNGTVFGAASVAVVRELAKTGQVDEALALAEKLNTPDFQMNYSNALSAIVYGIVDTDTPHALRLLATIPDDRQRSSCTAGVAKKLAARDPKLAQGMLEQVLDLRSKAGIITALTPVVAKTDLPAALALVKSVPPADQYQALIAIAGSVPVEKTAPLQQALSAAIAARFAEYRAQPSSGRGNMFRDLSALSLPALLVLEPSFANERETFARLLFLATGPACGLAQDPLWQRLMEIELPPLNRTIPWSCTYLRDALRAQP